MRKIKHYPWQNRVVHPKVAMRDERAFVNGIDGDYPKTKSWLRATRRLRRPERKFKIYYPENLPF